MMELRTEDCLLRGNSSDLVSVLRDEGLSTITLTRLSHVVTTDLRASAFSRVRIVMKSLEILSENRDDLETLISHGLTAKVLLWLEIVHELLTSDLQKSSAPLLSLTEVFYDYFLMLSQTSLPVSQLSVVLLQLARFVLEPEIHFPLRLEAIRTFNSILESLSKQQRRLIQNQQDQSQILSQMAASLLTVGDYELQVSLSEALCRLTPRKDRQQRANEWFSSRDISSAFCDIRDVDFEVDCRRFLNFVNRCRGDQRRVYTFPCLQAFLDSAELFPPEDDKLEKFWIDFNLSSGCVSFFINEPQGFLWGSVHLLKEDVDRYSLQLKHDGCTGAQTVLTVQLINPIMHHNKRGQTVELTFDPEHHRELEAAARRVFMVPSSPRQERSGGSVQGGRSYSRKKTPSKSQLKVLPLSSPSSDEDSPVIKFGGISSAEILFDQIRHSTLSYEAGVLVGAELDISQGEAEVFGGSSSPLMKPLFTCDRKRAAGDSGYLSDQTEGPSTQKRRAEPQPEGEESHSPFPEGSPEGVEPPDEEEEGLNDRVEEAGAKGCVLQSEVESEAGPDLTSGITAAFNTFKTQLDQLFTGCWQNIEAEVCLSLKECQQQVSSLLTAVHQHRLVLLQRFESNITDHLKQLQENSTSLNSINTQTLRFFQSEMQRLGSFCEEHLQRLKSLDSEALGTQQPPGQ